MGLPFVTNRFHVAFEEAACSTTRIRPYLARTLLGWSPRKPGFVDGMEVYYAAWKASQGS